MLAGKYNTTTPLNSITSPTANVSMNNFKITNLANPTSNNDCANKIYIDNAISALGSPTNITNGTMNLYYSTNYLRLKSNVLS